MVADLGAYCATDLASSGDTDHTEFAVDWFARISPRTEYRLPEMFISGDVENDGPAALFALYDATATGKRGVGGSLLPDPEAAALFGVTVRTIERWRALLELTGHCDTAPEGRYARKFVGKVYPQERFVLVPALVQRALLSGAISPLAYRLWALLTNTRIETGAQAGSFVGVGALARRLRRKAATIARALAEHDDAALLRVDDFGPGRPRRYVPQFARPVTQRLGEKVRRARESVYRIAGLLKKPKLASARTPSPHVGSTPSPNVGSAARSTSAFPQVGTDSPASRVGRDLFESDLSSDPPPERMSRAEWLARQQSRGMPT